MSASEQPHPRDRRSHGEEYPGKGDAEDLEEHYGAADEPDAPGEDDAKGDEEDEAG